MIVFHLEGEAGFYGNLTTATVKQFDHNLLNPPLLASHYVRYTTGATAALRKGETLTGGTSSATYQLIAQAVENGTAGSGDSGIILVRYLSGDPTAAGEVFTGGTSTGTVTTAQEPIPLDFHGNSPARSALITAEVGTINFTLDGTTPTATAGTNFGHQLASGQSYVISGWKNIRNAKFFNAVAASGAILKYSLLF